MQYEFIFKIIITQHKQSMENLMSEWRNNMTPAMVMK
jgi:hypothetical protein